MYLYGLISHGKIIINDLLSPIFCDRMGKVKEEVFFVTYNNEIFILLLCWSKMERLWRGRYAAVSGNLGPHGDL